MAIATLTTTQSSDDARQASSAVTLDASTINTAGGNVWLGFRFLTHAINDANLKGSVIDSAVFTGFTAGGDDPNLNFYGHDHDNAPTFTTTNNDISGRTPTDAVVNWTASNVGTFQSVNSPDLKTIIQEIIDRPGWNPGNAIALLLDSLGSDYIALYTYDYDGSTRLPTLTINYTPSGLSAAKVMYYRRLLA